MLQQQQNLMEALTVKLSNSSMGQSSAAGGSHSVDHLASSITDFLYDQKAHVTFDSRYKRYEDLFSVDLSAQDDAWKVVLLLRKLGSAEHERYANFILPKDPREVIFKDTAQTLSQIFVDQHRFRPERKPKHQSVGNSLSLLAASQLIASGRRKFVDVLLNGHAVCLQLDTASDITIISESLWQSLGSPMMQQTSKSATSACGGLVRLIWQLQCCVSFRGTSITAICYITQV
nr:unnamed protein product [Spirometra erinaceieuropaei]